MAVPKKKTSKMKKRQRRTHYTYSPPNVGRCPSCNAPVLPHHVCHECGQYRGRQVFERAEG